MPVIPANRLPVSISASVINPSVCSLYLTGANASTTPNLAGVVPSAQIGILVRDMSHASPFAPAALGNMNSENYYSGMHSIKVESPNFNTNGYVLLGGGNIDEVMHQADIANNGGITSLIYGSVLNDALGQNQEGLIKIYIKYYLTDITDNQPFIEEQPMILYHFASYKAAGVYGEIWGRGSYMDVPTQTPTSQNMEIRMSHMRTQAGGQQDTFTFQTFSEQEGPTGPSTPYTQYDQTAIGQNNTLSYNDDPPTSPSGSNNFNGQIIPFPNTVPQGGAIGSIVQAGIPTSYLDVTHNGNVVAYTNYFQNIHAGMQFGVAAFGEGKIGGQNQYSTIPGPNDTLHPSTANGINGADEGNTPNAYMSYTYFRVGAVDSEYVEVYVPGCTDPQACNYDPAATVNDGTCSFSENNYQTSNETATFDTSIPGQTTVSNFGVEVAWGTMTFSPNTYTTNPFASGNPTVNLAVSIDGAPEYIAATATIAPSSSTSTGATVTYVDTVTEIILQPGQSIFWYWQVVPVNSTCYLPNTTATLTHIAVDNQIAGCTSSTAYNYNPLATVDDGTCLYCTTAADLVVGFFDNPGGTPATNATSNDAEYGFNIQFGPAWGGGSTGTLHILEHVDSTAVLSASDIDNFLSASTVSANFLHVNSLPLSGSNNSVSSINLTNLTGGKMFTAVIEIDGGFGANSGCQYSTNFFTQYFDCTDITVPLGDPAPETIYTNYQQPIFIGPGLNIPANVQDISLCTINTDCNTLNIIVDIYFVGPAGPNSCDNVYHVDWAGVPLGPNYYHSLQIDVPTGGTTTLFSSSTTPLATTQGYVPITISQGSSSLSSNAGNYTATLTVTDITGALTCTESDSMTIQPSDLTICGCTDPSAYNHDSLANQDDGTCTYAGCTDHTAFNFIGLQFGAQTVDCNGNQITDIFGLGNQLADQSCCIYDIFDCTDPNATNYNPQATVDDGSCIYPVVPGCTDPGASLNSYNPQATIDDGSCLYVGCTDVNATNPTYYTNNLGIQVLANVSDGTCVYNQGQVPGCTDIAADNYNEDATVDDGSCTYGGTDGTGNGTEITTLVVPNYNDLIDQLDVCTSKALSSYHKKLITGQKCDKDRLLHLTIVKHLLDNRQIKCLFSGTSASLQKLNKLITFALSVCDDCEQDIAPLGELIGSEVVVVPTDLDFLQQANGSYVNQSTGNLFIQTNQNNII
jgi:hypothetical protein